MMPALKTLLLIDDDLDFGRALSDVFEDEGFDVLQAANAAAGVELALTRSPDVVLVDQNLPDRPGTVAVQDLRACGFAGPTVLVTGMPDLQHIAAQAGADGCITKPIDLEALLDLVHRAAEGLLP
jgi:DNA-binding response OmpR family regulator